MACFDKNGLQEDVILSSTTTKWSTIFSCFHQEHWVGFNFKPFFTELLTLLHIKNIYNCLFWQPLTVVIIDLAFCAIKITLNLKPGTDFSGYNNLKLNNFIFLLIFFLEYLNTLFAYFMQDQIIVCDITYFLLYLLPLVSKYFIKNINKIKIWFVLACFSSILFHILF